MKHQHMQDEGMARESDHRKDIRRAIDESLCNVHFDAQDMHAVLRGVRQDCAQNARRKRRRGFPMGMAFAAAVLLLLAPFAVTALRLSGLPGGAAGPGDPILSVSASPQESPAVAPLRALDLADASAREREAIRIARACFEAQCDTDVFSFEEYAVSAQQTQEGRYRVEMTSIYGNGCRFVVLADVASGEVLQYSLPQLATVPTYIDSSAPEVSAWYDKYGKHLFTWPMQEQAEFSRRYEGGALRVPREGEMSEAQAEQLAAGEAKAALGAQEVFAYAMLASERDDSAARYVVYCFEEAVGEERPARCAIVSFDAADGDNQTVTLQP